MATYLWATSNGSLEEAEYNEDTDRLSHEAVKEELVSALELFGHNVRCEPVNDNPNDRVYKITIQDTDYAPFYICIKGMTPGGRSSLRNEQRIQLQSQFINDAYSRTESGDKAILLGVYKRNDEAIFCAWKLKQSRADANIPVSKQIKIESIANAMKEGFVQQEKGHGEFACAFRREFIYFYIRNSDWLHGDTVTSLMENDSSITSTEVIEETTRRKGGANYLLYGVPGSGKSYAIAEQYCNDENRMERVVFHPDYTNSDFIGQILPTVTERNVSYEFIPGPFTRLMKKAQTHPNQEYFLIIEEINRGNAPAIFGEVLQLLDRDNEGISEYGISNSDIAKIVYDDETQFIRIPSNMSIIGTMNTSDQNVFTLDTAFQRRWNMRMIENDLSKVGFAENKILDTNVTWKQFNTIINNLILSNSVLVTSSEDKRLGGFFVLESDLLYDNKIDNPDASAEEKRLAIHQNNKFPEKILKYLWDDAFKFSRERIFETQQYTSLEDIVRKFKEGSGNDRFLVFKENVRTDLIGNS